MEQFDWKRKDWLFYLLTINIKMLKSPKKIFLNRKYSLILHNY